MNENTNSKKTKSADTQNTQTTREPLKDLEPRGEADVVRGGSNEVAIEGFGSFEPK